MLFKIRATSGLKFNLWRGEVRHLAGVGHAQLEPPTPTFCHVDAVFHLLSTSQQIRRRTGKYERLGRLGHTQATPPPPGGVSGSRVISVSKATPLYRSGLKATHSPAPVSRHASHVTASPPALSNYCHPADLVALTTPPPQHARHGRRHLDTATHHLHAAISTLPPTAPRHVPSPPRPPPLSTTTHTSNATRINPSRQTANNAAAAAPPPRATPAQSTPPPPHHTSPVPLNRPGLTSSLPVLQY
ncbi:hypothetical protein EDB83DRAFT_2517188 [Lactarius deliciosus]|nr:hypothetical protein EDB83DRAFT_2517188 [Lactarius deliciosus]